MAREEEKPCLNNAGNSAHHTLLRLRYKSKHETDDINLPFSPINLIMQAFATLNVILVCVDPGACVPFMAYLRLLYVSMFRYMCRFVGSKSHVLFFKSNLRNVQGF